MRRRQHEPFDNCSPTCTNEPRCTDADGNKRACTAVCGDGIKFPNEACDDGNRRNGDGCSAACAIESGYQCAVPPASRRA
jgi:cysteine-rich repeat protein